MWLLLSLLLLQPTPGDQPPQSDAEQLFALGVELFESNDFDGAIAAFEGVEATGRTSGELAFNLGTAYMHRGDVGEAVLHLERAKRLSDTREAAQHNLAIVSEREGLELPTSTLNTIQSSLIRFAPPLFWFAFAMVFLLATTFVAGRWIWLDRTSATQRRLLVVLSPIACILIALSVLLWSGVGSYNAVVLSDTEVFRSPSPQAASTAQVEEGQLVRIIRERNNWREVRLPNGASGWITSQKAGRI